LRHRVSIVFRSPIKLRTSISIYAVDLVRQGRPLFSWLRWRNAVWLLAGYGFVVVFA
jgi:hypothetical protein